METVRTRIAARRSLARALDWASGYLECVGGRVSEGPGPDPTVTATANGETLVYVPSNEPQPG